MENITLLDLHIRKNIRFDQAWIYSVQTLKKIEEDFRDIFDRFDVFIKDIKNKPFHRIFGYKIKKQYAEAKEVWNNIVLKIIISLTTIASGNTTLEKKVEKFLELIIK